VKIQIASDLHTEFHADQGQCLIAELRKDSDADVIVIAGDLSLSWGLMESFKFLCGCYQDVVYVPGNHEYYNISEFSYLKELLHAASYAYPNLHVLNPGVWEKEDTKFVGCTLWFPFQHDNEKHEHFMNDFEVIPSFKDIVYEENAKQVKFLWDNVTPGSIVITHHLPSYRSVDYKYIVSSLNRFFVCPEEDLIRIQDPAIWIHGHSHENCDYMMGMDDKELTRVICNPFGYARYATNPKFKSDLVIEI
jgi:predicted phosphodiesterase